MRLIGFCEGRPIVHSTKHIDWGEQSLEALVAIVLGHHFANGEVVNIYEIRLAAAELLTRFPNENLLPLTVKLVWEAHSRAKKMAGTRHQ